MSDIAISAGVRQNLLSLQSTADMMSETQNRLATGKKVNSALDNPSNFFTSSSLNSRASDMNALMDGMANGIKTIEAADNGLSAITKTLESMQSTLRQARQDKSFETQSLSLSSETVTSGITNDADADARQLTFSGGQFGESEQSLSLISGVDSTTTTLGAVTDGIDLEETADGVDFSLTVNEGTATDVKVRGVDGENQLSVQIGTNDAVTVNVADSSDVGREELVSALNSALGESSLGVTAGLDADNKLTFTGPASSDYTKAGVEVSAAAIQDGAGGTSPTLANFGFDAADPAQTETKEYTAKSVDTLVSEINDAEGAFEGKLRASNDDGKLRIENLSTQNLDIAGATSKGDIDGTSAKQSDAVEGNSVRAGLSEQYNELRDQLDKLADDASFNGVNLLRGDNLQITFNETGTSELNIQTEGGETINSANLNIPTEMNASDFDSDDGIDAFLGNVKTAINEVRAQSSSFGSSLSIVENRSAFTTSMVNTLETGADNLTLADSNEEAANLLALQTRQQLSSTALSMASQQDQAVLRLF